MEVSLAGRMSLYGLLACRKRMGKATGSASPRNYPEKNHCRHRKHLMVLQFQGELSIPCIGTNQMPAKARATLVKPKLLSTDKQLSETIESLRRLRIRDKDGESLLGSLPREIVYKIAEHLPLDSSLSLSATCRDLRCLLQPLVKETSKLGRQQLLGFLDRDQLTRSIAYEIISDHDDTHRACGACSTLHTTDLFDGGQLFQPPRLRACRGRRGKFRPCEHTAYSWDVMAQMPFDEDLDCGKEGTRDWAEVLHCQRCADEGSDGTFSKSWTWHQTNKNRLIARAIRDHKTFQFTKYRRIMEIPEGWTIRGEAIVRELGRLRWKVCPHTVTTSKQFSAIKPIKFKFIKGDKDDLKIQDVVWRSYEYCSHSGCKTELFIDVSCNDIRLGISRDLGAMEGPNEADWLVHSSVT
ncbi:hypothetical protein JOL62DRAFT_255602 [Phyllosticta paracitricarpa]|uniref:F-box domain-containing protein n=1 Tax=Phyllosticta paracitricarpa TaxID=2016321 RepID=A0ABR1N054_9PEZI